MGITKNLSSWSSAMKWGLFLYLAQFILTMVDLVNGGIGLAEFQSHVSTNITEGATSKHLYGVWIAGYVFAAFVCVSSLILILYQFSKLFCQSSKNWHKKADSCFTIWTTVNFLLEFIFEDCMVSVSKIALAFNSEEAENQLRSEAEKTASKTTLIVSCLQFLLVFIPIVYHHTKSESCCHNKLWLEILNLLSSSIAISTSTMSMCISHAVVSIDQNDPEDVHFKIVGFVLGWIALLFAVCFLPFWKCCYKSEENLWWNVVLIFSRK